MQVPREPRFRPVQMFDEWPLSRPQRPQGPAQQDNIKGLIYGEDEQKRPSTTTASSSAVVLGRRDPNQQSDPIQADKEHPWNRCGIKKVEPNHRPEHAHGKRVVHAHHNNFAGANDQAPWNHPESMTALEKKYANYGYNQNNINNNNNNNQFVDDQKQDFRRAPSTSASSVSSSSCSSIARRRAQQQAQASNWYVLTKQSPFITPGMENHNGNGDDDDQYDKESSFSFSSSSACRVGEPKHLPNYSATGPRLNSSAKLIQLMRILAQTTKRSNGELWQSVLEGNILRKPFHSAPTMNVTKQEKMMKMMGCDEEEEDQGFDAKNNNNNNIRLRRSVPLYELAIQLEAALGGQQISEKVLADALGFGECNNENAPVRYEHFLRLFNA